MKAITKIVYIIVCAIYVSCSISIEPSLIIKAATDEDVCSNISLQMVENRVCEENESGNRIYLDSQQTHFLPYENVVISYSVSSNKNILDFNYSQNGFNVISINVDENNRSRLIVELSCVSNSPECTFDISVSLENGENIDTSLFAVSNEYGVFISSFSVDNALERYCQYAIQNNILTEEQARNLFLTRYKITADKKITVESNVSNTAMTVNTMSTMTDSIIYDGFLSWSDDKGDVHWLRRVRVELYSKIGDILVLLNTTHTDNNGYYKFNVDPGTYVVLKIYAGDSNAMVKSGILFSDYCSEIDVGLCEETVSVCTCNETFSMSDDFGKALQISQAVLTARDYAWVMMGKMPSNVTIRYPYSDGFYYDDEYSLIKIAYKEGDVTTFPYSYASWDAIMHEYGHHIQYQMKITNSPKVNHSSSQNDADARKNKDEGVRLAWAESWPTVFALMAQQYYRNELTNIETTANSTYASYIIEEYDIEINDVRLGEACEQSIMAVLWDLFDSVSDERDTISLGHEAFWAVTTESESKTFSDFINHFYNTYPEYIDDIGPNLTYYKMASSSPLMSNASGISQTISPIFTWDTYYKND